MSSTSLPDSCTSPPDARRRARRPAWKKLVFAAIACVALALAWRFTPLAEFATRERIVAFARGVHDTQWAPLVVILAFTPAAFLMFPRPLLTLFAVVAFGPWLGLAYSFAGVLGATLATYGAGRALRYDTVRRIAGDDVERLTKALRSHGLLAVLAVNMVPVPPFGLQGIIAGAVRVRMRDYVLGCTIAMAPGVLAATLFGKELASVLEQPGNVSYWIAGVGLALFVALTWFFRRWTRTVWEQGA